MMKLQLENGRTVRLDPNGALRHKPRLSLLSHRAVRVGPWYSADEYDHHLARTTGSGGVYDHSSEEFRFDVHSHELIGLGLSLPEDSAEDPLLAECWLDAPSLSGGLTLETPSCFTLEGPDLKWAPPDGSKVLACLETHTPDSQLLRVRVAEDLALLFADGLYSGWLLEQPASHLAAGWDSARTPCEDPRLPPLLAEYINLVDDNFVELMEDEDAPARGALIDLYGRVEMRPRCPQQQELMSTVLDLLDRFYEWQPRTGVQ